MLISFFPTVFSSELFYYYCVCVSSTNAHLNYMQLLLIGSNVCFFGEFVNSELKRLTKKLIMQGYIEKSL